MVTIPEPNQKSLVANHQNAASFLRPVTSEEFIPSTGRWLSITGFILTGAIAIAGIMSSTVKYNITVKASGIVRPAGEVRLVQTGVEGIVKNILVKENQAVRQGQIIAELDDRQQQIKKSQLQGNIQQTKLQIFYLSSQIQSITNQMTAEEQSISKGIASAQADLAKNQREYEDKKATSQSDLLAAESQLEKEKADLQKAQADLEFAEDELKRYRILVTSGAISQSDFNKKILAVKQKKSEVMAVKKTVDIAIARCKSARINLNPSNANVAIARQRIAQERAKGQANLEMLKKEKQALTQRSVEMQSQLSQSVQELEQIEVQLHKNIIRATSDGIILKLNLHNNSQVLRSGEVIAQIIPLNAPMVIKAMIPSADISKIAIGQKVQLRVESCSYPDYGTLEAKVRNISPDVIAPSNNNSADTTIRPSSSNSSYFETTIAPDKLTFGNNQRMCRIQAGMEVKADIISKEETPLEFLLRKARLMTDL